MRILSRRSNLLKMAKDSIRETILCMKLGNIQERDFSTVPPYFGFSLNGCIGRKVSWQERICFFTFMFHFLKTSLLTGEEEAKKRGGILVQLANANKFALNNYLVNSNKGLGDAMGLQDGFISVHRTEEMAIRAVEEVRRYGEKAELLPMSQALELEPKLKHLPLNDSYFVLRKSDRSADCVQFTRDVIQSFQSSDLIRYESGNGAVQDIGILGSEGKDTKKKFQVTLSDGTMNDFDHIVLAAGILTPILAARIAMRSGQSCPIFPLRGYSLTLYTEPEAEGPFLKKALSFDNIYCTSVAPNMVRLAGFGEIAGFPNGGTDVCPRVGPMVIEKYAKHIFGKYSTSKIIGSTLPCFRPMSPDDVPLVGSIEEVPGLFVHSGHGTLGWTLSLATAYCLAQDVCDELLNVKGRDYSYDLPDGTYIHKSYLRPDRFHILPFV